MTEMPERIWVAGSPQECGQYFPNATEAEGAWGGIGVEYITLAASDARVEAAVRAGYAAGVKRAAAVPENHVAFLIANHITAFNSDLHIVAGDIRVIAADPAEVKRIVEGLATPKGDSQ